MKVSPINSIPSEATTEILPAAPELSGNAAVDNCAPSKSLNCTRQNTNISTRTTPGGFR
uniref:Uncharacterized protein n=1 Tax=Desertifilum tharense IPPAS B-1220 TaxID=1781255 RepID=A0ACD5H1E6_9CYAN